MSSDSQSKIFLYRVKIFFYPLLILPYVCRYVIHDTSSIERTRGRFLVKGLLTCPPPHHCAGAGQGHHHCVELCGDGEWRRVLMSSSTMTALGDHCPLGAGGNLTQAPHPASGVLLLYRANIFYCQECNSRGCVLNSSTSHMSTTHSRSGEYAELKI